MPVLVDGNNLLYAARDLEPADWIPGRAALCARLAEWSRRRRYEVTVVFDGRRPEPSLARQIAPEGVNVVFSGPGVTADSVLIAHLNRNSAPRRLIVVSTDREIAKAARRRRARPMRSDEFYKRLLRDLARPARRTVEPREKRTGLSPHQVDEWLREMGFDSE